MSKYWHRRNRYDSGRPEDFIFLLLVILVSSIFYPPLRQVIMSLWYIYAFAILGMGVIIASKIYHYRRLSKAGIYEVDKMSGTDFEKYLIILFEKLGYRAEHVGHSGGDYGVDLVLESDGVKTAVQAKRHSGKVGDDAIQAVVGGKNYYGCTETMVITNNYFTPMAEDLAKVDDVELWNRDKLIDTIIKSQSSVKEQSQLSSDDDEIPLCPKCNLPMVKRLGKYGKFWGCIHFPGCNGTRNIE